MFKVFVMAAMLLAAPLIEPAPPCDPAETLCWMLPVFPAAPPATNVPLAFATPSYSEAYMTHQPTQQAQMEAMLAPISTANGLGDAWLGEEGIVPDTNGEDVNAGLEPLDSQGSMLEVAADMGEQSGELFSLVRALTFILHSSLAPFLIAMLIAAALFAIVHLFVLAIQIGDMLFNVFDKLFMWFVGFVDLLNPFV